VTQHHLRLRPAQAGRRQAGIALLVVLIMVLLVTLAGIAAVRTLVVEERMASNSLDRNLAMQSAERVLREAEALAFAQSVATPFNTAYTPAANANQPNGSYSGTCTSTGDTDPSPCTSGYCSQPSPTCAARWTDTNFNGWVAVIASTPAAAASASTGSDATLADGTQQQYIIEFLGKKFACDPNDPDDKYNCAQYRITVRTNTGTERAVVQLQSYFLAQPK
jgi:type IV pilus assembly protein PilX